MRRRLEAAWRIICHGIRCRDWSVTSSSCLADLRTSVHVPAGRLRDDRQCAGLHDILAGGQPRQGGEDGRGDRRLWPRCNTWLRRPRQGVRPMLVLPWPLMARTHLVACSAALANAALHFHSDFGLDLIGLNCTRAAMLGINFPSTLTPLISFRCEHGTERSSRTWTRC